MILKKTEINIVYIYITPAPCKLYGGESRQEITRDISE